MSWSIPLVTILGTEVRIHVTFLLLLAWIGIAAGASGGSGAAIDALVYVVALFACVLAHEFGHVIAARRYGVRTPDITLLPIGGVANLERIPEKPSEELVVALAGPAVNVAIAAVLYLLGARFDMTGLNEVATPAGDLGSRLMAVNLFLVVFNLIPAFPMDGGRVLRALLATRMSHARATQIAATIGQGVAFVLGFAGLFGNPLLIFIAIFVYLAASAEAGQAQLHDMARGVPASDAMITAFESLGPQATVDDAAEALIRTTQKEFPVVDGAGRLRGILTRDAMITAMRDTGPGTPVAGVMTAGIPTVGRRAALKDALKLMETSRPPAIGVTDADGRLMGLITSENLGEMLMIRAVRPERPLVGPWERPG